MKNILHSCGLSLDDLKKLLIFILILVPLKLFSQVNALIISHADNTKTVIELYTLPCVILKNDTVSITSPFVSMKWAAKDVVRFAYDKTFTSVDPVCEEESLTYKSGCLLFHHCTNYDIAVYDVKGNPVFIDFFQRGNDLVLSLDNFARGIYVISLNGRTFKIQKP